MHLWHKVGFARKAPGCGSERPPPRGHSQGREAGATVNTKLRDLNIGVSLQDERAIEVVASGLPFHQSRRYHVA